jgi:hypothetical protein
MFGWIVLRSPGRCNSFDARLHYDRNPGICPDCAIRAVSLARGTDASRGINMMRNRMPVGYHRPHIKNCWGGFAMKLAMAGLWVLVGAILVAPQARADIKVGVVVSASGRARRWASRRCGPSPPLPKEIAGEKVTYIALDDESDPTKGTRMPAASSSRMASTS